MTVDEVVARYLPAARRLAAKHVRGGNHLADDLESAAMEGLLLAARAAMRDGLDVESAGAYVNRTVRLRLIDVLRREGRYLRDSRAGKERAMLVDPCTLAEVTPADRCAFRTSGPEPSDGDTQPGIHSRRPLAPGTQRVLSRTLARTPTALAMRWL